MPDEAQPLISAALRKRAVPDRQTGFRLRCPAAEYPACVDPGKIADWLKIRFRVGEILRNRKVVLYLDGEKAMSKRRHVMAPGEMEEILLTKKELNRHPDLKSIEIKVEEG